MQTVIRITPEGETKAFCEYTPQEVDAARLAEECGLIASGKRAKPSMGSALGAGPAPIVGRERTKSRHTQ